jgi:hypothetical protein
MSFDGQGFTPLAAKSCVCDHNAKLFAFKIAFLIVKSTDVAAAAALRFQLFVVFVPDK